MSNQPVHKANAAFSLVQSSIQCKAGCGFFGNPEWLGYCSICFKQLYINQQLQQQQFFPQPTLQPQPQPQPPPVEQPAPSPVVPSSPVSSATTSGDQPTSQRLSWLTQPQYLFDKFRNMNLSIGQEPAVDYCPSPSSSPSIASVGQPPMSKSASYHVGWMDCSRYTNKFAKDFLALEKQADKTINQLSDLIHEFYQTITERFESQFIYKGLTQDQLELLGDNVERLLNERIYQVISARIINEDEEHIMAIQKRIRSLNWINKEHLEIEMDFENPIVQDLLDKAIYQMIEMNSRTSSIDKLDCIVQCSKTIIDLLQVNRINRDGRSVPVSADQFLPVLVFVVIQANPPMLPADMKYLTRFSNPRRLMSGETGYYFTNLCCALEFIEKATGASLNISEDDFAKYMSGQVKKSQTSEALKTVYSNDESLKNLKQSSESRQAKMEDLAQQIDVHLEINRSKLDEVQTSTSDLKEKLKVNFPNFYKDLLIQNKELAKKLLPAYLR